MNLRETIRVAVSGLAANRLRSALTMLGILIGVGAVILLVAVGAGSSAAIQNRIKGLGTNVLTISAQGGFRPGRSNIGTSSRANQLTPADVTALQNKTNNPDIAAVAPSVNAQSAAGSYNGVTHTPATFTGTTPAFPGIRNYAVASGSFFTSDDLTNHSRVVVIGQTVATDMFGNENPIGKTVKFGSTQWLVQGVLAAKGTNGAQDQDDIVFAPLTTVQDYLTGKTTGYSQITVQAVSSKRMDEAASEIDTTLRSTHKLSATATANYQVQNQATLLETSTSTTKTFTVLLGAVAAISLLVGGIGVMNIMLVTVTERTREIGIRKAIGAKKADILGQFLAEAVLLSFLGGVVGVCAGLLGSQFNIAGVAPVVQPYSVALAFGVAIAVGIFFGLYPANRAASLRPIEALRYE